MEKKYPARMEVKADGEQGLVRAVFATLNVVDSDGDVTLPGAFGAQEVFISAWGHKWDGLVVGEGTIGEEGDKAMFDGAFFLDTDAGLQHFRTLKRTGKRQEWSYGFRVIDSEPGEFNGQQVRFLKGLKVFEVSPVMIGAGVDTMTVAIKGADLTFADHAEHVLASVQEFIERSGSLAGLRSKEGRDLSAANRAKLSELRDLLGACAKDIEGLLDTDEPEKGLALFAEYQRNLARLQGVAV